MYIKKNGLILYHLIFYIDVDDFTDVMIFFVVKIALKHCLCYWYSRENIKIYDYLFCSLKLLTRLFYINSCNKYIIM